jgi:hypothetical protein
MITLSIDEILAMLAYMAQVRRAGKPLWHTFWYGGDALGDRLTPPVAQREIDCKRCSGA